MKKFLIFMTIVVLGGCSDDGVALTEDEMTVLFSTEQSALFKGFRYSGRAVLKTDQTATLDVFVLGKDVGTWWLDGASICSKWDEAFGKKTVCARFEKHPDGHYSAYHPTSGLKLGTFTLDP